MYRTLVRKTKEKGLCVYAAEDIPKGGLIETCDMLVIPRPPEGHILHRYCYDWNDKENLLLFGNGMVYNHSFDPNMVTNWDKAFRKVKRPFVRFYASRDIKAGEELTHDYGPDYPYTWMPRGTKYKTVRGRTIANPPGLL